MKIGRHTDKFAPPQLRLKAPVVTAGWAGRDRAPCRAERVTGAAPVVRGKASVIERLMKLSELAASEGLLEPPKDGTRWR